jgi:two-component system, chemotaxis family, chemotaxis protein CheY
MMKKILIIDDSPLARKFHVNILRTSGFATDVANDGIQGLEKALSQKYDVIICDINMPNMDGLAFTSTYREHNDLTPIIVLTTQEQDIHRQKALEAGANLYLVKPATPADLVVHLKMIIGDESC